MQFIIHIGAHKTGSTALQHFLLMNRELLLAEGYLYPGSGLDKYAHHTLAWAVRDGNQQQYREILAGIENEARQSGVDKVILSSEEFEFIKNKQNLAPLQALDPKIIVFLRRPDYVLESAYKQHVRMFKRRYAHDIFRFHFQHEFTSRFDAVKLCDAWSLGMNKKSLIVLNYDQCRTDSNAIYQQFIAQLGITFTNKFKLPEESKSNISIHNLGSMYLARLNRLELNLRQHEQGVAWIREKFATMPKRSLLGYEDRLSLWRKTAASHEFLIKKYDFSPFAPPDAQEESEAPLVDFCDDFDPEIFRQLRQAAEKTGILTGLSFLSRKRQE